MRSARLETIPANSRNIVANSASRLRDSASSLAQRSSMRLNSLVQVNCMCSKRSINLRLISCCCESTAFSFQGKDSLSPLATDWTGGPGKYNGYMDGERGAFGKSQPHSQVVDEDRTCCPLRRAACRPCRCCGKVEAGGFRVASNRWMGESHVSATLTDLRSCPRHRLVAGDWLPP